MNLRFPTSTALADIRWPKLPLPLPRAGGESRPRKPVFPRWMHQVHWRTSIGAVLLGGILHIGATLAVPLAGPGTAFKTLSDRLPANAMVVASPPSPDEQLLPFMLPDAFYAICRYSLADGPVTVSAPLTDAGWTLSLHTPHGENFYVMPGQQARPADIALTIVSGVEHSSSLIPAAGRRSIVAAEDQIASPTDEGLIVLRAPLRGLAWRAETETALSRAKCARAPKP